MTLPDALTTEATVETVRVVACAAAGFVLTILIVGVI